MNLSHPYEERLSHLAESLIPGFEVLLTGIRIHIDDGKLLRERLEHAANEVSKPALPFIPPGPIFIVMRVL